MKLALPSPQALVAFLLALFLLLVVLRAQVGLGPNVAAAISFAVAIALGLLVDRFIPEDDYVDDADEADTDVASGDARADGRPDASTPKPG